MSDTKRTDGILSLLWSNFWVKQNGKNAIDKIQSKRLSEMISYARTYSPFYKNLYSHLPEFIVEISNLQVTRKKDLMADFDQWITNRDIKLQEVQAFVNDQSNIGLPYLQDYTVATTSGTTGVPGVFLMDPHAMKVTSSIAVRMLTSWLSAKDIIRILVRGRRFSMIMAKNGHYASSTAAARMQKRLSKNFLALSAQQPVHELVQALNNFKPDLLAPYASIASLLATEQEKRKLDIHPVLIALSAEGLPESEYSRIAKIFDTTVGNSYASTECPFLSYSCKQGWLHVNSDWVVIEPVDQNYRPVAPGVQSYTVLITNLANRIQPIIRYDLGDSIILKAEPCSCGNNLPAIKVTGRSSEVLTFKTAAGELISVPPLAFSIMVDNIPGAESVQVVQTAEDQLRIRLRHSGTNTLAELRQNVHDAVRRLLDERSLNHISVTIGDEPPEQTAAGKFRGAIPLKMI